MTTQQPDYTMVAYMSSLNKRLSRIEGSLSALVTLHKDMQPRVQMLNDWHNRVNGALWVLGGIGGATLAVVTGLAPTILRLILPPE